MTQEDAQAVKSALLDDLGQVFEVFGGELVVDKGEVDQEIVVLGWQTVESGVLDQVSYVVFVLYGWLCADELQEFPVGFQREHADFMLGHVYYFFSQSFALP